MGEIVTASVVVVLTTGNWVLGTSPNVQIIWNTTENGNTNLRLSSTQPLPGFDFLSNRGNQGGIVSSHSYTLTVPSVVTPGQWYGFYPVTDDPGTGDPMFGTFGEHPSGTFVTPGSNTPVITSLSSSGITTNSATIKWTVSGVSNSSDTVYYGVSGFALDRSTSGESNTENKQVTLYGLSPSNVYEYYATSASGVGIVNSSSFLFNTLPVPSTGYPKLAPPAELNPDFHQDALNIALSSDVSGRLNVGSNSNGLGGSVAASNLTNQNYISSDQFMNDILR